MLIIQLGLTPDRDMGAVVEGKFTLKDAVTHYADGKFDIFGRTLRFRQHGIADQPKVCSQESFGSAT